MDQETIDDNNAPCGFWDQTQCPDAKFSGTLPSKFNTPEKKLQRLIQSRDILKSHVKDLDEKIAIVEHQLDVDHPGWRDLPKVQVVFDPEDDWPKKL